MMHNWIACDNDRAILAPNGGADGFIHIFFNQHIPDELGGTRNQFLWKIYDSEGDLIYAAEDNKTDPILSGVNAEVDAMDAASALLSFMGACAESQQSDGENADLFPDVVIDWIVMIEDDLATLQFEIEQHREGEDGCSE